MVSVLDNGPSPSRGSAQQGSPKQRSTTPQAASNHAANSATSDPVPSVTASSASSASSAPANPTKADSPTAPTNSAPRDDTNNAHTGQNNPLATGVKKLNAKYVDGFSLSTKLVSIIIVLLTVGTVGITISLRQLLSNYLMDKTDSQLVQQAELVFKNTDILNNNLNSSNGLTTYYVKAYNKLDDHSATLLQPVFKNGVISSPDLPDDGSLDGHKLGVPWTAPSRVTLEDPATVPDYATLKMAEAPWRVVAMRWMNKTNSGSMQDLGIVYIGLSLNSQIDMVDTLTKFCVLVGIAVVLLGGVISAVAVQHTLEPLKRIEKKAALIAGGDLTQRIDTAPVNTEVGSLARSLNIMLMKVERSFRQQQATTDKMKRFVSDASHELRTPLAAIHGYAELYKMQRDMPGALERADVSIEHIEASSSRMTLLVEDLLSLARLDEGRGISVDQTVKLCSVLRDSLDDLHALDPERKVSTGVLTLGPDLYNGQPPALKEQPEPLPDLTITGDPNKLRQVITNIVGNIHRYTPSDSPVEIAAGTIGLDISPKDLHALPSEPASLERILFAASQYREDKLGVPYAFIRIADHGPGVPEESQAKIFERFYTADPSRARQKGGTGLGMAIAYSVVQAHSGFITATTTPGGGLTFLIVLPVSQDFREDSSDDLLF
ncbi:sensor histidine kinase [Bifidobacterium gallicum]|nr:HAMP domain-containing sensor histidine kinase [Bifidobacterium gallicum]EFA23271.1 ATPase/histidine kinase/DNA gyrase B/HSP90 domain protein [Bifidobacterium gallicum DSM 20093 = LMG 11596]